MSRLNSSAALVSVGIPVYNESARIADCVKNVRAQTYSNVEICISDNCSSDDTYEIAKRLAEAGDKIAVVRQDHPISVYENFGAVRRMATGRYFMWLGADDRISPNYIEKMVEQLEKRPGAAVVQSAVVRVDEGGNFLQEVRFGDAFDQDRDGPLRQAMRALTPIRSLQRFKLNLYVYGLYRKSIIDGIVGEKALARGDRVLPALAALSGGLRYVEQPLFTKRVRLAHEKRSADDPVLVERRNNKRVKSIVWWVLRCSTIPLWRRWYGLIIAFPFVAERVLRAGRAAIPQPMRMALKGLLSSIRISPPKPGKVKF